MCVGVVVGWLGFFNRGNTEGTNSSKILCFMFVYTCMFCFKYKFVSSGFVDLREFVV